MQKRSLISNDLLLFGALKKKKSSVLSLEMIPDFCLKEYQPKFCSCISGLVVLSCFPGLPSGTHCTTVPGVPYKMLTMQTVKREPSTGPRRKIFHLWSKYQIPAHCHLLSYKLLESILHQDKIIPLGNSFCHQFIVLLLKLL